jgi:hypothetical protein
VSQIQQHACPSEEVWMRHIQVELELAANHPAAAMQCLEEAERLAQSIHLGSFQPDLLAERSAVLLANGHAQGALEISDQAMALLNPGWNIHPNVLYHHSRALAACGSKVEAYPVLAQAAQAVNTLIGSLPPQQQTTSRERVPMHREILQAWEKLQPRQVSVRLPPHPGALPTIPVTWTLWLSEDDEIQGKVERRRHQLGRLLAEAASQGASPASSQLAEALGVSVRTIAQDLAEQRRPAKQ